MKRLVAVFFGTGLVLLSLLLSCGRGDKATQITAPVDGSNPYAVPITVSMSMLDAESLLKTDREKWLLDKFNLNFKFVAVTNGDWNEKVRAMVAGDDIPDVLWWHGTPRVSLELRVWMEQGAFREINQTDIDARPGIKAILDSIVTDDNMLSYGGKRYGIPGKRALDPELKGASWNHFTYRRDWAKAVGLYKEGDVYTWDEVLAMIDAVRKEDPGQNGAGNTFGITCAPWALPDLFVQHLGFLKNRFGYQKTADGYIPIFATPGWREEVKFLTRIYRGGYFWKDQVLAKNVEGLDNFKAGRSFIYMGEGGADFYNNQLYPVMMDKAITNTMDIGPLLILSPVDNKSFHLSQEVEYWSFSMFRHGLDDGPYKRMLDFWEYLTTEEARAWYWAGIPDVDYKRVSDTEIELLWGKTADGRWAKPYGETEPWYGRSVPRMYFPYMSMVDRAGYDSMKPMADFLKTSSVYSVIEKWSWDLINFDGPLYGQFGDFRTNELEFVKAACTATEDIDVMIDRWLKEMEPRWRPVADELNKNL
jgi:ABC-type glycerol-3-phosphate transport system substrate-binding protein